MADGPAALLECRWGKLRLFASRVNTQGGRTLIVHSPASGDVHPTQDRGLVARRVRCHLQFDDFPGQPSALESARALNAAKDSGESALFQHPIEGRFMASVGEFNSEIDEHSVITAEAEFVQQSADAAVTAIGPGTSPSVGEVAVNAAAEAMDTQLANLGQLKMSAAGAAAVTAKLPGTSGVLTRLSQVRGSITMTVASSKAFAININGQVASAANGLAADAAAIVGAPTETQFSAFAASSALNSLLLTPAGEQFDLTTVLPAPSGFGAKTADPANVLGMQASADAQQGMFAATTLDARVSVARWKQDGVTARDVIIDASRISSNIALMIEVGGFETDLGLWSAFRAAIMLGGAVRNAAAAATSDAPAIFLMRVRARTALLPLVAQLYGGAEAFERERQVLSLNNIPTPGWLDPGDYAMPVKS